MDEVKNNLKGEIKILEGRIAENEKLSRSEQDPEMKQLISDEINSLKRQIEQLRTSLDSLENPDIGTHTEDEEDTIDPNTAILEIRAGTGGDEAALFATDLYKMYLKFAENKGWDSKLHVLSENLPDGIKMASVTLKGKNAYNLLNRESGVHRVQRVPETESSGRIHTSTATVAVLPKVSPVKVELKPEDLKMDFYRSGGKGGQNVNKVSTAVRLTHIPTGITVECQEERTQGRNREKAMDILRSRIYNVMLQKQINDITELRSDQVGSAERSEKIRTYNFPQDRITDHRIQKNWHNIESVMAGDLDKIISDLHSRELPQE